jgi:phage terminase small subunit
MTSILRINADEDVTAVRGPVVPQHSAVVEPIEEPKLLTIDSKKEYEKLRELLLSLSAFQVRFVEQYIRTASAGMAAKLAGSQSNTPEAVGYKLLQLPKIQQCIAIAMKKRIEAVGLDSIEVIHKIRTLYDRCMEEGKFDTAAKACELLQRELNSVHKGGKSVVDTAGDTPGAKKANASRELRDLDDTEFENSKADLDRVLSIVARSTSNVKTKDF